MPKKYRVTLTAEEREELERLAVPGQGGCALLKHAQILLKADEAEDRAGLVGRAHRRSLRGGGRHHRAACASALSRRACRRRCDPTARGQRIYERKLDGAQEAHLIALACSAPPEGRARWTLRLLAQRMVELAYVDTLSHETVRQTLKKERPQTAPQADVVHPRQALGGVRLPHGRRAGGLPPPVRSQAPGGVRGRDLQAADRRDPRAPAAAAGFGGRVDHVYTRNGVASLFLACEPLAGLAPHRR